MYVDHVRGERLALFDVIRRRDLERIIAKWAHGSVRFGSGPLAQDQEPGVLANRGAVGNASAAAYGGGGMN
jgi:hypothetical protein